MDVRKSIRVCLVYYLNWLKGLGAVALENLMEVTSTVEICRTQLHLWLQNRARIIKDKESIYFDTELMLSYVDKEA